MTDLIFKEESYKIIGVCMEVHNWPGSGLPEIVYKDAIEYEFCKANIPFEREKEYIVNYKDIMLPHKFYADFVVFDKIIPEVKAISAIKDEFVAQAINYLSISKNKLALIVNFGEISLSYKRVVKWPRITNNFIIRQLVAIFTFYIFYLALKLTSLRSVELRFVPVGFADSKISRLN
jgi:GxxExxY protein